MKKDLQAGDEDEESPKLVNSLVVEVSALEGQGKPYSLGLYMKPMANLVGC